MLESLKQSGPSYDLMVVVCGTYWRTSAMFPPSLLTTRRSTGTLATAPLTEITDKANPAMAPSRRRCVLLIRATPSSRVVLAGRGQVSWLPGSAAAPSQGADGFPSG